MLALVIGGLAILGIWGARSHAKRLASKRSGIAPSSLIDLLVAAGVDEPVAEFVWDTLGPYYGEGDILPHPDDDLSDDAGIDPEDVEDIVAEFFRRFGLPEPTGQQPEMIPAPMNIVAFAHYLDSRRREKAAI